MVKRVWLISIGSEKYVLDGMVSASQLEEVIAVLDKMRKVEYVYQSDRVAGTTYTYKNADKPDDVKAELLPAKEVEGC